MRVLLWEPAVDALTERWDADAREIARTNSGRFTVLYVHDGSGKAAIHQHAAMRFLNALVGEPDAPTAWRTARADLTGVIGAYAALTRERAQVWAMAKAIELQTRARPNVLALLSEPGEPQ